MDLFADTAQQLADDAEGGIRYWPAFVDAGLARAWFDRLRAEVGWRLEQRPMYDRVVDVPRMLAAFRLDDVPADSPLPAMLERILRFAPAPYNAVGLNLYRDGRDSVAMHNDKLHSIVPPHPIALVSLGSPRRMLVRAKTGDRGSLAIELEPGSLLVMSHASQRTHDHGIPKTARAVGERMSVVFRVRPDAGRRY